MAALDSRSSARPMSQISTPDLPPATGLLVLVVGPSGVGKDALLDAAHAALAGDPSVVFARREVTRPADAGGETHIPVDMATFRVRQAVGGYLLSWEANGHGYGLPKALLADLQAGRTVVANASRAVLPAARAMFGRLKVISVTARPEIVAARLRRRGRESPREMEARLARAAAYAVDGPDVVQVSNDGPLEEGAAALLAAIGADPPSAH